MGSTSLESSGVLSDRKYIPWGKLWNLVWLVNTLYETVDQNFWIVVVVESPYLIKKNNLNFV